MSDLTNKLLALNGTNWLFLDDDTREELKAQAAEENRALVKRYDPETGESYLAESE